MSQRSRLNISIVSESVSLRSYFSAATINRLINFPSTNLTWFCFTIELQWFPLVLNENQAEVYRRRATAASIISNILISNSLKQIRNRINDVNNKCALPIIIFLFGVCFSGTTGASQVLSTGFMRPHEELWGWDDRLLYCYDGAMILGSQFYSCCDSTSIKTLWYYFPFSFPS